jgi:hypothetical protein
MKAKKYSIFGFSIFFSSFQSVSSSNWIQTLYLGMLKIVFYHCAGLAVSTLLLLELTTITSLYIVGKIKKKLNRASLLRAAQHSSQGLTTRKYLR